MSNMPSASSETRTRTIVKAVLWNLIGLAVMALVGFLLTGSWSVGGSMAVINAILGLTMYILYERVWAHIRWGRHAAH
ncbi:MAG: DUF2061 domain-containing protein [Pseudomonadota bacterium]